MRAGSVAYVESEDGRLRPLVARDVRGIRERLKSALALLLLPEGGASAVTPDYWVFSRANFVRTLLSSAGAVLGTRALLRAIGVGSVAATGGSAALNWVLKDGLGRLGAIAAASLIGNRFDNDAKSYYLLGDITYELGVGVELCAPLCPPAFLLIGSLANALKSTSYMLRLPPRAAFLKAFARRENVGDLSAKSNAQEVVAGMLGMGLGIAVSALVGDAHVGLLAAYCTTLASVLLCSLTALRGLRLRTLNWARTRLLLRAYLAAGGGAAPVPSPREVNAAERLPSWGLGRPPERLLPVRYGAPLHHTAPTAAALRRLATLYAGQRYLLSLAPAAGGRRAAAQVSVREDAAAGDALLAMLQAARLQEAIARSGAEWSDEERWAQTEAAFRAATAELPLLQAAMRGSGWNTSVVLWAPARVCDWSPVEAEGCCPLPGGG